ncbi:hypothetical protein [Archangium sp. Cb G35]|uniref:hypothetical protein n=1 Tax=Archangium sp. Cb G35 TaxID=1920190 RepID=UPI0009369044|nr:hypothetical protein [Archangium sp. Cb G35]
MNSEPCCSTSNRCCLPGYRPRAGWCCNFGSVWLPTSTHEGGEIETVNQIGPSCLVKRFELKVVVTDSCGVTATASKIVYYNASECPWLNPGER